MSYLTKRIFQIIASTVILFLVGPILLVIALIIRINLGSPVFFYQIRSGLHGKPFKLWKFRTMNNDRDINGNLLPDSERLSSFGNILRSTSLDEFPEIFNIIKGDMSFVGPRPLLMQYLERYTPLQARRHEVKPGITGWAQVKGRNALSWEKKFQLDVWYVDNKSFWLDVKIILITIKKVFLKEGITAEGEATMPEFLGSDRTKRR